MAHSLSTGSACGSPSPVILKRKRTKRRRTLPPTPSTAAASSSASSNSAELEHNTADYLILLAKGEANPAEQAGRPAQPAVGNNFILYRCKTCDKCFSTFQALGGHRASHRKPKVAALETDGSVAKPTDSSPPTSAGGKQRTHECSICGSEFSSGQALGGHMRRHRPAAAHLENGLLKANNKEKRVLLPDLNLPSPADDDPFVNGHPLHY